MNTSRLAALLRASVIALPIVSLASIAPTAQAQAVRIMSGGPAMGGGGISKASLDQYARILRLDDAQKEAAGALFESYQAATREAQKEMDEAMKAGHEKAEAGDHSFFAEKMPGIMRKNRERQSAATKSMLDDLKALLSEKQQANWDTLERYRRRESGLRFNPVGGASVDLFKLVDKLKLSPEQRAPLDETLAGYEQDLDRILQDREERQAKEMKEFEAKEKDAAKDGGPMTFDMTAMQEQMEKDRKEGIRIRDLNRQYQRRLAGQLPDDLRAKFEDEFKLRSYREAYRPSSLNKTLSAAKGLDDLSEAQKQQVNTIQEGYLREATSLSERLASEIEKADNEGARTQPFFMHGGDDSSPLASVRKARRELEEKTRERLASTLTDKQRERLPKPRQEGLMGGQFITTTTTTGDGGDHVMVATFETEDDDGEFDISAIGGMIGDAVQVHIALPATPAQPAQPAPAPKK